MMKRLLRCTRASAAVEAAIFSPILLLMTLGITDLGTGMFVRMAVNAATQAGAGYVVINSGTGSTCASLSTTCLNNIRAAMQDATGDLSFCTGTNCTASISVCADGSSQCVIVSADYGWSPLLPDALYSWSRTMTISSRTSIRLF
jgi:Flp pilus assembly protein TadG